MARKNYPYFFNERVEYKIYRKACKSKGLHAGQEDEIYKFSKWEEDVKKKMKYCQYYNNRVNLIGYLKQREAECKNKLELMKSFVLPVCIAIVTTWIGVYMKPDNANAVFLICGRLLWGILAIGGGCALHKMRKIRFYRDYIAIIETM